MNDSESIKWPEDFTHQLSEGFPASKARVHLDFMKKQLEKYGGVEGKDFIFKRTANGDTALFTLGVRKVPFSHYEKAPFNKEER